MNYDEHLISMAGGDGDLHQGEHAIWCNGHTHFGPCRRGRVTGTEKPASPGGDGDTTDHLAAIEARVNAATPGPWARPLNTRYRASVTADMPKGDPSSRWRNQVDHEGNPERVSIVNCPIWSDGKFFRKQSGRDLEFIAHARTDVPALLAMVREQRAALEAVSAIADKMDEAVRLRHGAPGLTSYTAGQLRAALTATEGA